MHLIRHSHFTPWRDLDRFFEAAGEAAWTPAFDIDETEKTYVLRGDLPGVPQKDIEVRVDEGVLTVRGERKLPEKTDLFRRLERRSGKFLRRFRLAETIDTENVKASYVDGVLELTLPKQEPVDRSRLIPVN